MQTFNAFPNTLHDIDNSSLDAFLVSQTSFVLHLSGRLQENSGFRGFSRTLIVNYDGSNFSVKNDMLFLHSNVKKNS
jgi:hypothetical protein